MLTSATPTHTKIARLTRQNGFTFLELMVCMVITGVTLSLAIGLFQMSPTGVSEVASRVKLTLSYARAEAMLLGQHVELALDSRALYRKRDGKLHVVEKFPHGVHVLSCDDAFMGSKLVDFVFAPTGVALEHTVQLAQKENAITLYVPPVGETLMLHGEYSLQTAREEMLQ